MILRGLLRLAGFHTVSFKRMSSASHGTKVSLPRKAGLAAANTTRQIIQLQQLLRSTQNLGLLSNWQPATERPLGANKLSGERQECSSKLVQRVDERMTVTEEPLSQGLQLVKAAAKGHTAAG